MPRKQLSLTQRMYIRGQYQQGVRPHVLAEQLGLNRTTIQVVVRDLPRPTYWQTAKRRGKSPKNVVVPPTEKGITPYSLRRRCGHRETFRLHMEPSPYYLQCVREERCAACRKMHHAKYVREV